MVLLPLVLLLLIPSRTKTHHPACPHARRTLPAPHRLPTGMHRASRYTFALYLSHCIRANMAPSCWMERGAGQCLLAFGACAGGAPGMDQT